MKVELVSVKLDSLILSEENPRQIKKGKFDELKKSIRDFPEMLNLREIVVDENNRVLGGHQRVRALLALGNKEIAVKRAIGLTDDQKMEFMAKDNIHQGAWDSDIVANLWDVDKLNGWGANIKEAPEREYYGDERERTFKAMNLDSYDSLEVSGKYQIPSLYPCKRIPEKLIGFNEAGSSKDIDCGVHFFIDDYQFERVWSNPKKYIKMLSRFDCVLTPDFSLYTDMPLAMKIWNVYRARMIGQILQNEGLFVIPTIMFADKDTYEFCFDGVPKNAVVATSTVGVMRSEESLEIWKSGMTEAILRLEPETVLLYGGDVQGFDWMGVSVRNYSTRVFDV